MEDCYFITGKSCVKYMSNAKRMLNSILKRFLSFVILDKLHKRHQILYNDNHNKYLNEFINTLNLVHEIRKKQKSKASRHSPLWSFTRRTGSRKIDKVMDDAGITGAMACPKGLRHAFGIHCVMNEIPLPTIQKWLGHSSMETTAIYLQVMGKEERELASRIW